MEYPQEVVVEEVEEEEVEAAEEDFLLQHQHNKQLPMGETNSSATHPSHLQEIVPSRKNS